MTNVRTNSKPSPSRIDRDWPFQVALPDDLCVMHNLTLVVDFCSDHDLTDLTRHVTVMWQGHRPEVFRLLCFADLDSARLFQKHFGGVMFDPKRDRHKGKARGAWYRDEPRKRVLESGPLSVPECLRD